MQAPLPRWKWEQTKHKFIRLLENPVFLKENKEKVTWSDRTFHSVFRKKQNDNYILLPTSSNRLLFNSFIAKQNKYTYSVISQLHFKQTHATIKNFPRLTMGMCADVPPLASRFHFGKKAIHSELQLVSAQCVQCGAFPFTMLTREKSVCLHLKLSSTMQYIPKPHTCAEAVRQRYLLQYSYKS